MSEFFIRKLDWDKKNQDGIPVDCLGIMQFFNNGLKAGKYPLIPRKTPITEQEIRNLWIPNRHNTITYVAIDSNNNKVVAASTLTIDRSQNIGEISITKDHKNKIPGIGTILFKSVILDAIKEKIKVVVHTSVENLAMIRIMEKLGASNRIIIKNYSRYVNKINATNFDVYQWEIDSLTNDGSL